MKQISPAYFLKTLVIFSLLILAAFMTFAQDATTSTTSTTSTVTTEETWYLQPWAWIAGGVLLLILLISLFRGKSTGNTTDSVTYTKTVKRDEE